MNSSVINFGETDGQKIVKVLSSMVNFLFMKSWCVNIEGEIYIGTFSDISS